MSSTIKQTIEALKSRIADAYTAVSAKGGTLPATQDSANLPAAIESIPSGGVSDVYVRSIVLDEDVEDVDCSNIVFKGFGNKGLFYGYAVYTKNITIRGLRGRSGSFENLLNGYPMVKNMYFADMTINTSMNFMRGNVKKFDLTGLHVGPKASGTGGQSFTYSTITTLIGDHTLQEALDGLTALDGLFFSFTLQGSSVDRASLRAVINGLADMTGQTAPTLTIGSTLMSKLTADDIAVATNKNWTIA